MDDEELVIALQRILAHRQRRSVPQRELRRKIKTHQDLSPKELVEKCKTLDQSLRRIGIRFSVGPARSSPNVPWISRIERQENA